MECFDDHYSGSPKGKPAMKSILIRAVPEASTQMAELLGEWTDWVEDLNADQFEDKIWPAQQRKGGSGNTSRHRLRKHDEGIHSGVTGISDAACYKGKFGCDQSLAVHYTYDPVKAKQLLAEVRYPVRFETDICTYLSPTGGDAVQN
jgi:peptide/nickel transport system substrate-binding protein